MGPQSLRFLSAICVSVCEDTGGLSGTESTYSLCQLWLGNGGPRNPGAAQTAAGAGGAFGLQHLRNHNHDDGFRCSSTPANQTNGEVFDSRAMMICGSMWTASSPWTRRYAPSRSGQDERQDSR